MFYCQKVCGEVGFSITEWNDTAAELDKTDMNEDEKNKILFPEPCINQCFDCMAIVGERQLKTKSLKAKT